MCRQLQVSNQFGYREALVLKNVSYVWNHNCESFSSSKVFPEIKFMTSSQGQFIQNTKDTIIPGDQLMIADYLSLGLNMTMNFVHSNPIGGEDPNTGLYFEINGDVFLNYPFLTAYNLISSHINPVSSPIYDAMGGGILSLKKPKSPSVSQIIGIFDAKIYFLLLLCILFVAAFLKWCGQKSKLCGRSYHRQCIEMSLLIGFDPRTYGLIREKSCVIRIVIGASILTGFIMRKCFGCQLNAVWMLESFDYVSDLNESLKAHPRIQRILTNFMGGTILSSRWDLYEKPYDVPLYDDREEVMILGDLLEGDAVYLYVFEVLKQVQIKYPFLPTQLSRLNGFFGQTTIYYFPIYRHSPHFAKIYKRYVFN